MCVMYKHVVSAHISEGATQAGDKDLRTSWIQIPTFWAAAFNTLLMKPSRPHTVRTDLMKIYQVSWGTSVAC